MKRAASLLWSTILWVVDRTILIIIAAYLAAILEAVKVDLLGYTLPNL